MPNTEHTPGPWRAVTATVREDASGLPCRAIVGADGAFVALLDKIDSPNKHGAEDARLIAAAPDLLAALVECEDLLAELADGGAENPELEIARAAIAKARGTAEG